MDEKTFISLDAEIEPNRVYGTCKGGDSVDGFKKFVKKQLEKMCIDFGRKSPEGSGTPTSLNSLDFRECKTALTFSETKHKGQGDSGDIYDFTHRNRGIAVIINNEDFSPSSNFGPRPGSSYDEVALHKTFKNLGFDVLVSRNLTGNKMVELLKLVKDKYDHVNADCFVCSILSHGDEVIARRADERAGSKVRHDVLFGIDGVSVSTKIIVEIFSDRYCPGLEGKPRLFFLQACRGNKYDHAIDILVSRPVFTSKISARTGNDNKDKSSCVDQQDKRATKHQNSTSSSVDPPEYQQRHADSTDANPGSSHDEIGQADLKAPVESTSIKDVYMPLWNPIRDVPVCPTPLYKDCLVMYATPPGHYAWRRRNGAWFVQSLCKVLDSPQISQVSLLRALVLTSRQVAFYYQSENPSNLQMHQKKETPVIESMLVKDVFFITT